jgi:hypothetical protein
MLKYKNFSSLRNIKTVYPFIRQLENRQGIALLLRRNKMKAQSNTKPEKIKIAAVALLQEKPETFEFDIWLLFKRGIINP